MALFSSLLWPKKVLNPRLFALLDRSSSSDEKICASNEDRETDRLRVGRDMGLPMGAFWMGRRAGRANRLD
jgi:hypothetical protein